MSRRRLTLRTPQQLSLSRATSFNKHVVKTFFELYRELRLKHNFLAKDIYNLDECGIQTVHKTTKVITDIGDKYVQSMTSAERGTLITMVAIIGAAGKAVPPFLIFPRVFFNESKMMRNCYESAAGGASTTGWINADLFLDVLKHFVAHENPNPQSPKLIILDNHESHISLPAIDYAKAHGIVLFTLPPHTSQRLQPLDVSVFRSFKHFFNKQCTNWMLNHPGKTISIYEMAELSGNAFKQSFTLSNITSGFRATGLQPFNDEIFTDADFNKASVTDRPEPNQPTDNCTTSASQSNSAQIDTTVNQNLNSSEESIVTQIKSHVVQTQSNISQVPQTEPDIAQVAPTQSDITHVAQTRSNVTQTESNTAPTKSDTALTKSDTAPTNLIVDTNPNSPVGAQTTSKDSITPPEAIRPYPQAGARKDSKRKPRKKGRSLVLTSTPVKNEIEAEVVRKKTLQMEKEKRKNEMIQVS